VRADCVFSRVIGFDLWLAAPTKKVDFWGVGEYVHVDGNSYYNYVNYVYIGSTEAASFQSPCNPNCFRNIHQP
jgi:hypothetical protein